MDVAGTVSLIFDIPAIASDIGFDSGSTDMLRASKSTRVGARAARLTRLIRLIKVVRIVRVVKLLKYFMNTGPEKKEDDALKSASKVSQELSDTISKRVAALVMLMVIVVPFLQFVEVDTAIPAHHEFLNQMASRNQTIEPDQIAEFFNYHALMDAGTRPFRLDILNMSTNVWATHLPADHWRGSTDRSTLSFVMASDELEYVRIYVNTSDKVQAEAWYNIGLVLVVIVVLISFSSMLHSKIDALVVAPLERIMAAINGAMAELMAAMGGMDGKKEAGSDSSEGEMGQLESAVNKLSKIGAQVTHASKGRHKVVSAAMNDASLDTTTKDWLNDQYATGHDQGNQKSPKKGSKVIVNGGAGLADADSGAEVPTLSVKSAEESAAAHEVCCITWDCLTLESDGDLFRSLHLIFTEAQVYSNFFVPTAAASSFFSACRAGYDNSNSYHNFYHAVDTVQTTYMFLSHIDGPQRAIFEDIDIFAVMVGALGHDLGHPGVNSLFLINTRHDLAMTYNDTSVLENMHISTLYGILKSDTTNIFIGLDHSQWTNARKTIISSVLATDMAHHFKMVSDVDMFYSLNEDKINAMDPDVRAECFRNKGTRVMVLNLLMHAADISNAAKPFDICEKWAGRVMEEFFSQGDMERDKGMNVSAMFDRHSTNPYQMQCNFIEFVVGPLYLGMIKLFPELKEYGENLVENRRLWGKKWIANLQETSDDAAAAAEEITKIHGRMEGFDRKFFPQKFEEGGAAGDNPLADIAGGVTPSSARRTVVGGRKTIVSGKDAAAGASNSVRPSS
jgi:hypothetical protein